MPKVNESAKIAQIHYIYQSRPNVERAHRYAKRKLGRLGYELDEKNTNADILTATQGNNVHMNYSGTNINNPRDIVSDIALGTGLQKLNQQFTERRKKTREIMRSYGDDKDYSLSAHSLGGSILMDTLARSKSIRQRVSTAHTFNAGYTKMFHDSIPSLDKQEKKELDKKVSHHRVKGDIVSAHMPKQIAFGQLAEYEHEDKKNADLFEKHSLDTFTESDL
jgi:hypothetical protein